MRISAHRGSKRAYMAVALSMLIAIYHILKEGVVFKDPAAQLYGEFKEFFPENAVEYFVSWYGFDL